MVKDKPVVRFRVKEKPFTWDILAMTICFRSLATLFSVGHSLSPKIFQEFHLRTTLLLQGHSAVRVALIFFFLLYFVAMDYPKFYFCHKVLGIICHVL